MTIMHLIFGISTLLLLQNVDADYFPKRCFGDLGCFDNGGWWALRQPNKLPQSPDEIGTTFLLNTRKNPDPESAKVVNYENPEAVKAQGYDPHKPTKILVHGFLASSSDGAWPEMTTAFLNAMDVNVIRVDWSKGNGFPYEQATANARVVGAQIGLFIQRLQRLFDTPTSGFHVVGHSLGAHLAGYAGQRVKGSGSGLGRITGLDPAEPYFQFLHRSIRLDESDADFVDVIHTDGQSIFGVILGGSGFGMMQQSGHVDFYPNGGLRQPGCSKKDLCKDIMTGNIKGITDAVACSHNRANHLFVESLKSAASGSCRFKAFECSSYSRFKRGECRSCKNVLHNNNNNNDNNTDDYAWGKSSKLCGEMGIHADGLKGAKGVKLYLDTNDKSPYCH